MIRIALFSLLLTAGTAVLRATAAESTFTVLNAGASASEDAPYVPASYRFLAGDFVYYTFQVAGFAVAENEEKATRTISLSYEASFEDEVGVLLAPKQSGAIDVSLSPEDKNWLPKRRGSFLVPSFLAASEFRIRLTVNDHLGHHQTTFDIPIRIGGEAIERSNSISIQHFHFTRSPEDREPLAVPAYRPGDPVFLSFDITGFSLKEANHYRLSYSLVVIGPDGKEFFRQNDAGEMADATFYPAQVLPAGFEISTKPVSARGTYTVILSVADKVANKSQELRQIFTLE